MSEPYFEERSGELIPQAASGSSWGTSHLRGLAVSGAMAREVERQMSARPGFVPVRWTVDLFRPARMTPSTATASVVRSSSRLCLVDALFCQHGEPVSRASALYLLPSTTPQGRVWNHADRIAPPDPGVRPDCERLYHSGSSWTPPATDHVNAHRKAVWHFPVPLVADEPLTPFQTAATIADIANLTTSFGTNGLEYINPDFTLSLARLPDGPDIGLIATSRIEHLGIATGTAAMFDRSGTFATVTVSGLANSRNAIRNPVPTAPA